MLDEALHALQDLQELRQLELIVKNFTLCADQLRIIGESAWHSCSFSSALDKPNSWVAGLRPCCCTSAAGMGQWDELFAWFVIEIPAGSLPLTELRLDSFIYKQQPTLSRSSYSHVDNEGVKALVDAICNRW
jgi:hypothetical protein